MPLRLKDTKGVSSIGWGIGRSWSMFQAARVGFACTLACYVFAAAKVYTE